MADQIEEENNKAKSEPEPKTPTMAETEEHPQNQLQLPEKLNVSFSIWPPSQRTRDAVISRLIETLSTPSVLSKRYGAFPEAEATDTAFRIEDEAFSATAASASKDDDGIEILQAYSKQISKRMLEIFKSRSASVSESSVDCPPASNTTSEEISTAQTETN